MVLLASKIRGQRCTCVLMVDKTFNPNSNAIVYLIYPLNLSHCVTMCAVEPNSEDVPRVSYYKVIRVKLHKTPRHLNREVAELILATAHIVLQCERFSKR
jgi:hypothetical protein